MAIRYLVLIVVALAGGCAQRQVYVERPTEADRAEALKPLTCQGPGQCAEYWKRAQVWIAQNSRMKIQLATDAVIETFDPPNYPAVRGYRITRTPMADGIERISIASACNSEWTCATDEYLDAVKFKRFVRQ